MQRYQCQPIEKKNKTSEICHRTSFDGYFQDDYVLCEVDFTKIVSDDNDKNGR